MSDEKPETTESSRRDAFRRLIELERECADLRTSLGVEHRLEPVLVPDGTEHAAYALLARYASDFLSVHAADGTYLWASPSCERLFGWKPSEMIGRPAYEFLHPDDRPRIAANHEQHVALEQAESIEFRFRCADSSHRWVETHSANHKTTTSVPQIVCITRDISARRAREEEVRRLLTSYEDAVARGEIKDASGFLRLCAWCKSVGDAERATWTPIEDYLAAQAGHVSHGICPTCLAEFAQSERTPRGV